MINCPSCFNSSWRVCFLTVAILALLMFLLLSWPDLQEPENVSVDSVLLQENSRELPIPDENMHQEKRGSVLRERIPLHSKGGDVSIHGKVIPVSGSRKCMGSALLYMKNSKRRTLDSSCSPAVVAPIEDGVFDIRTKVEANELNWGIIVVRCNGYGRAMSRCFEMSGGAQHELEFRLPAAGRIKGRVLSHKNRPIGNSRIEITSRADAGKNTPWLLTAYTDTDGYFQFTNIPVRDGAGSEWSLSASKAGFYTKLLKQPIRVLGDGTTETVEIRLRKPNCPLSGRVLDVQGNPLPGARIKIFVQGSHLESPFIDTVCDEFGMYSLESFSFREGGRFVVEVTHPVAGQALFMKLTGDLQYPEKWILKGIVSDPEGRPCPDASVYVQMVPPSLITLTTDQDGLFYTDTIHFKPHRVIACHDEYGPVIFDKPYAKHQFDGIEGAAYRWEAYPEEPRHTELELKLQNRQSLSSFFPGLSKDDISDELRIRFESNSYEFLNNLTIPLSEIIFTKDGNVLEADLWPGSWKVSLLRDEQVLISQSFNIHPTGWPGASVKTFNWFRPEQEFKIMASDTQEPIPGVVLRREAQSAQNPLSDREGRIILNPPLNPKEKLTLKHPDFRVKEIRFDDFTDDEFQILLYPHTSLTGTLIVPENEAGRSWTAHVRLPENLGPFDDSEQTGLKNGKPFRMDKVPAGQVHFRISFGGITRLEMELHLQRGMNDLGELHVPPR